MKASDQIFSTHSSSVFGVLFFFFLCVCCPHFGTSYWNISCQRTMTITNSRSMCNLSIRWRRVWKKEKPRANGEEAGGDGLGGRMMRGGDHREWWWQTVKERNYRELMGIRRIALAYHQQTYKYICLHMHKSSKFQALPNPPTHLSFEFHQYSRLTLCVGPVARLARPLHHHRHPTTIE